QLALVPGDFIPAETNRRFTVTCTEHAATVLVPGIIARLRAEAPNAGLRILPSNMGVAEVFDPGAPRWRSAVSGAFLRRSPSNQSCARPGSGWSAPTIRLPTSR